MKLNRGFFGRLMVYRAILIFPIHLRKSARSAEKKIRIYVMFDSMKLPAYFADMREFISA
ncbi:MAG: hypothetical protein ACI8YO_000002 [Gammaproteobacteria bacterium]|jgi:hypothetical protein